MWHEPPANAILMFKNTKSRNIKITALGSWHRYQIIIMYITQKRGTNCIYPTKPQIGWPKTTDNIFTLVSYGVQVYTLTTIF